MRPPSRPPRFAPPTRGPVEEDFLARIPPRRFDVPITVSTNMARELNGRITRSAPSQCFQWLDFTALFVEAFRPKG